MKKQRYKNLIYFQNGSIGDFLMTIFFLENIHLNDNSLVLNVVVPKNFYFLQQFLEKYPYINLEEAEELVVSQTGETVRKSIYCSFHSVVFPVPAIITDDNNVYFVDPIIQEVW